MRFGFTPVVACAKDDSSTKEVEFEACDTGPDPQNPPSCGELVTMGLDWTTLLNGRAGAFAPGQAGTSGIVCPFRACGLDMFGK
jgi:hypothetical protein